MSRSPTQQAEQLYETFYQFESRKIGQFAAGFAIPTEVYLSGDAHEIFYRSDKWEHKSHDYVHQHDAGVKTYHSTDRTGEGWLVRVPQRICEAKSLVRLGLCIGFSYHDPNGDLVEAKVRQPAPELYAVPSGKALLIVVGKRRVEAMIWGGGLHITSHGIVA